MGLFWAKYARRIFAIVSTTSIPNLAPVSPTEATVDPPSRGSRLDADHPENGVLIPRRFTRSVAGSPMCARRLTRLLPPFDRNDRSPPPTAPAATEPSFEVENLDRG